MITFNAKKWLLAAAMLLTACGPHKKAQTPNPEEFAPYIKAYTGGIVADDVQIRVDLTGDAAQMPLEGLFTLSPKAEGVTQWTSASQVRFIPSEGALKAGTTYTVRFALGKVRPGAPEEFVFGLTVKGRPAAEQADQAAQEPGQGFRVVSTVLEDSHIDVVLSHTPANARVKGLVELQGAARSYLEVEDSLVRVHFEGRKGDLTLTLDPALKDLDGETLGQAFTRVFRAKEEAPAVQLLVKGNILPDKNRIILPFRAVNLSAVEVRIVKIYEKNVLNFLQENDLDGTSALRRVGRLVYKADIPLDASKDLHQWNDHSLDLGGLFKKEPGAIYNVRLSFRMDQSLYGGKEPLRSIAGGDGTPSEKDEAVWDKAEPYWWENWYDWENYNWEEAGDPAKPSYYMDADRFPYVQLLCSDIGLMAGYAGGDCLWAAATDLLSARPLPGVTLEVYDYQLQPVGAAKTDSKGLAQIPVSRKPFVVVGKAGGSTAYLKVKDGAERSLSRFDVGGEVLQGGLKAFIYGERGVWRPGDTLHVNLLLSDKGRNLPQDHPATLELYTPAGQFHSRLVRRAVDGFFCYDIPTRADDPTGYWNAYFKVGGSTFHKTLHIESVKPNRLKVSTAYPELLQAGSTVTVPLSAAWLSGSAANGNAARAQMTLRKMKGAPFKGFEKYTFTDPSSSFSATEYELFKTRLSAAGEGTVDVNLPSAEGAPGMLTAFIVTSVEEDGGDESFTTQSLPYSPYSAYVGIRVPDGEYLETDQEQTVRLAVLDGAGRRVRGHKLEYVLYKLGWNWWWENPGADLDAYVNGSTCTKVTGGVLTSASEDVSFTFRVDYPAWGRYLILARDCASGHVSGRIVTVDWPEYRGRAERKDPESLTMLSFSTDKPAYQAGEKATVYIPAAAGAQALVSLENAAGVLQREWVATAADKDTPYSFTVTPRMAPNFYVHVTLVQPHGAVANDLPLRLYGVQRVKVENPASHLEPVVQAPQVIHPEEEFTLKVSEKNGKAMTYTLAIVDEGLLDLTAFRTPDPWAQMYKDEALGVKTWDLYDQVVGAFSGRFAPLSAIGGDQDNIVSARKDNRFNPVVLCLPPKTLAKGTDAIRLKLPMYVGSVRVMVVAAHEGAFGSAEKTVPVKNPLMVVTTLPRVLGTAEEIAVPVNVFAMEDGVQEATVQIKADGPVRITGGAAQKISFEAPGDQLVRFGLQATGEGTAHITVTAAGSGYKAVETLALPVRNPHPETAQVERFTLPAGASRQIKGSPGTTLQMAGFPIADVRSLYLSMRDYPYECAEQLSARGLVMVYLMPLLDAADAAEARSLIPSLIQKLYGRQNADGGFSYWGGDKSRTWVSSMAGQFLWEASKAGFNVNESVLKAWKQYQQKTSQVYRMAGNNFFSHLDEAYRLYTLSLCGSPSVSGMNRLKEAGTDLGDRARWMLAGAYALSGKGSQAGALLDGTGRDFPEYEPYNLTYGTALRDRMVALDALALSGRVADALTLATEAPAQGLSTQESAFTAMAWRHLYDKVPTAGGVSVVPVPRDTTVRGGADGPLYGTLVRTSRQPVAQAAANSLQIEVRWLGEDGRALNPASLQQGTRFRAVIKVTNPSGVRSYENLALSLPIPSGWEIRNERLTGGAGQDGYDHMDLRDDRADWFFALPAGSSKTFAVGLRAAYEGSYILPATVCRAMYEPAVSAHTASGSAAVTR